MPCSECQANSQRAERIEEAERLLLLFTDTFSRLARSLSEIETEHLQRHYAANPPPPGGAPLKRRRFLLVPFDQPVGDPGEAAASA